MAGFPFADGADVDAEYSGKALGAEAKRLAGGFEGGGSHSSNSLSIKTANLCQVSHSRRSIVIFS